MREVSDEQASDELGGVLASGPGDTDDPPLRAKVGEVVEVELLRPRRVPLLGLLEKPRLNLLSPVLAHLALSPLVPQLPSLSGAQLGGGRLEGRGDGQQWGLVGEGSPSSSVEA